MYLRDQELRRDKALWASYTLSALTGERVTVAQLLGEEGVDVASREAEAEADLERKFAAMEKAGIRAPQPLLPEPAVELPYTGPEGVV